MMINQINYKNKFYQGEMEHQDSNKLYGMSPNLSQSIKVPNKNQHNSFNYRHYYPESTLMGNQYNSSFEVYNEFNMFKNDQLLVLHELKQQYQILKSIPIEDRISKPSKLTDSIASSGRDDQSQSISKSKRKDHSRQLQMLSIQKKQLEMIVNNSMGRVQQLLQVQIDLKRQIHSLKLKLQERDTDQKYQTIIRSYKLKEKDYQQNLQAIKRDLQNKKSIIAKLNTQLSQKEEEIKLLREENKAINQILRTCKDKLINQQIQNKRLKMQLQMVEKQSQNYINRLQKQFDGKIQKQEINYYQNKIKRLQQQLELKQKRYNMLLQRFSDKNNNFDDIKNMMEQIGLSSSHKSQYQQLKYQQLKEVINDLKSQNKILKEELKKHMDIPSQNVQNSIILQNLQALMRKLEHGSKQSEDGLRKDIESLKIQINQAKYNSNNSQKINQQQKIIKQLQNIVQKQSFEKDKFLQQLTAIRNQYEQIYKSNQIVKNNLGVALEKERNLKYQVQKLKNQINVLCSTKVDLTSSQNENLHLKLKIGELDRLSNENQNLRKQVNNYRISVKQQQQQYENKIKILKTTISDLQFQINKLKKEGQLNLQLAQKNYLSESTIMKSDSQNAYKLKLKYEQYINNINQNNQNKLRQADLQRQNIKKSYEQKLNEKSLQMQNIRQRFQQIMMQKTTLIDNWKLPYDQKMEAKCLQIETLKRNFDNYVTNIKNDHQQQIKNLSVRLQSLMEANSRFLMKNQQLIQMESHYFELKNIVKKFMLMNQTVDHLWQVKQVQYANINQLLNQIRS